MRRSLHCWSLWSVLGLCVLACSREAASPGPANVEPERAAAKAEPQPSAAKPPLVIAYSDWPGWVAWDIAAAKGFFREAGVSVELRWLEYVPSMEAFAQGKVDAVCMTNGDALVLAGGGAQSVGILINDYSNGNDMIVAQPGIENIAGLRGKKVAVEVGFVDHLLLLRALQSAGMTESDVEIVNERTHKTPDLLASGAVSAIAAWQPNSGQALARVSGSRALFTSADAPGLIYDLLFVQPSSLRERPADWAKVAAVWFHVADYIRDVHTRDDAVRIMSQRVKLTPEAYARLIDGTYILDLAGNHKHFARGPGLDSVYGSSAIVDRFNVDNHIYKESPAIDPLLDASLIANLMAGSSSARAP